LSQRSAIADMHFMLQKEVVDRMTAASGGKEYGRLTVMLGVYAAAERLFDVGPGAFKPPPKVWSAVIRVRPTPGPRFTIGSDAALRTLVTAAFSHRRKTLRNGLRSFLRETDFESCGIDPERRPETLEPAEFGRLAARYCQNAGAP
jgi:16S rRNA (adenine1518-N6/adenine1519-N6)-dimethyltransferase